jgi:2-oxoglutarate dehydrogenase E2 component (dihydrolipoamide succinyltransferase)
MGSEIMKICVPLLPESVADAVVAAWLKQEGDFVHAEEALLELETDKVVLEVTAPKAGILTQIIEAKDAIVISNQVLATLDETQNETQTKPKQSTVYSNNSINTTNDTQKVSSSPKKYSDYEPPMSPSVRQSLGKQKLDYYEVLGTGKKGRILKKEPQQYVKRLIKRPYKTRYKRQNDLKNVFR